MKFELYFIGKTTEKHLQEGIAHYERKLGHYMKTEIKIIPASSDRDREKALAAEGEKILKGLSTSDFIIVLDERGREFTSVQFSGEIQKILNKSFPKIVFITGSAYGISAALKKRANLMLSFSKFTFTHQMIRLLLTEQLYRAMTILKGEAYHHD